jgi:ribosomal protein L11 methyltransferase
VLYPALDIPAPFSELIYALLDEHAPTAIEERDAGLRVFFASEAARDAALRAIGSQYPASAVDVPDEDWARRSQQNLPPVTVGRITISPPTATNPFTTPNPESRTTNPDDVVITISPSMGFGTGHHATTRLCLAALQTIDLRGRTVLDVGTGSGILAIAARLLGAARTVGVDVDPDAIQSARENLDLNPDAAGVEFECADLADGPLPAAAVVTANLTGALLVRSAETLRAATADGGTLILSGMLTDERDDVARAFGAAAVVWERHEDEWVALAVKKS